MNWKCSSDMPRFSSICALMESSENMPQTAPQGPKLHRKAHEYTTYLNYCSDMKETIELDCTGLMNCHGLCFDGISSLLGSLRVMGSLTPNCCLLVLGQLDALIGPFMSLRQFFRHWIAIPNHYSPFRVTLELPDSSECSEPMSLHSAFEMFQCINQSIN